MGIAGRNRVRAYIEGRDLGMVWQNRIEAHETIESQMRIVGEFLDSLRLVIVWPPKGEKKGKRKTDE